MRLWPGSWHAETWVCSLRGHVVPAAKVKTLLPTDADLGFERDGKRMVRCLRCDTWLRVDPPAQPIGELIRPLNEIKLPRRGKQLEEAILLRMLAVNRGLHAIGFAAVAVLLALVRSNLSGLHRWAGTLLDKIDGQLDASGRAPSRDFFGRRLESLLDLKANGLTILMVTALVYAAIEGVEAVGLWRERRWAEYLTVIATAGFIPFEIHELVKHVTVIRVGALVINVVVLVWLVLSKHLFGVRGGPSTLAHATDWSDLIANPIPAAIDQDSRDAIAVAAT